jgi:hypothetical protein
MCYSDLINVHNLPARNVVGDTQIRFAPIPIILKLSIPRGVRFNANRCGSFVWIVRLRISRFLSKRAS